MLTVTSSRSVIYAVTGDTVNTLITTMKNGIRNARFMTKVRPAHISNEFVRSICAFLIPQLVCKCQRKWFYLTQEAHRIIGGNLTDKKPIP